MRSVAFRPLEYLLGFSFVVSSIAIGGAPSSTAVTYQGQLKFEGQPANMTVDLRFTLHEDPVADAPVADPVEKLDIDVVDGQFSVQVDFGAKPFDGSPRWIQVDVRPSDAAAKYTALLPRQPVTPVPYALVAVNGNGSGPWLNDGGDVHNTNAGNVGIGDSSPLSLLTVGEGDLFQVSGTDGSLSFADEQASITFPATTGPNHPMIQMFDSGSSNADRMVIAHSPAYPDWGLRYEDSTDSFSFVSNGNAGLTIGLSPASLKMTTSSTNGARVKLKGTGTGLSFSLGAVDFLDGTDAVQGGMAYIRSLVGDRLILSAGGSERLYIDQAGRVGIGTAAPAEALHVVGNIKADLGIKTGGAVAINLDSPTELLDVNGNMLARGRVIANANNGGPGLWVRGGGDVQPDSTGYFVAGELNGTNVAIDNNEIMARNNHVVSTLNLNINGGTVAVGEDLSVSNDINVDGDVNVGGRVGMGYQIVEHTIRSNGGSESVGVGCPSGKKVLGGGCFGAGNNDTLDTCSPSGDNGWNCFWSTTDNDFIYTARAICAYID